MDGKRRYTKEALDAALLVLQKEGKKSLRAVARNYGIPETTLRRHFKNSSISLRRGPAPLLTPKEEDALVEYVNEVSHIGLPISYEQLKKKGNLILSKKMKLPVDRFKKNLGNKWLRRYLLRHPEIVQKKAEKTDPKRLDLSISTIEQYFENLRKIRLENKISEDRIFNADETGIPLSPIIPTTLGIKGKPRFIRSAEIREQITMLVTISTHGKALKPLFIWRGKTVQEYQAKQLPPNTLISATPKGFMTSEIFEEWITRFIDEAKVTPENPALLILDAHQSRGNVDALKFAIMSGLHILILPGGATHLLQPLDKAIFKIFKNNYRKEMQDENGEKAALRDKPTKIDVICTATKVLNEMMTEERIRNAFICTGIEPFSPQIIIDKLKAPKRKQPELSNNELIGLLAPTIVIQKVESKKGGKRFQIANKVATSEEVLEILTKKKEEKKKPAKRQRKQ
jgi:4-hydroxybenzoate polyprenyltransferase